MIAAGLLLSPQAAWAADAAAPDTEETQKGIDPGGSISDAAKITLGNTYEGTISDTNTRDFYCFKLEKAAAVTLNITARMERVKCTIYNAQGEQAAAWIPKWNTTTKINMLNEQVSLRTGTYYFAVEQYYTPLDVYSGNYSFQISAGVPQEFADVAQNAYYAKAVTWAVDKEITSGLTSTMFGPNQDCTRGQIVTMLWRAMGSPEPSENKTSFKDIKSSEYFYKPILWAVETGITSGTTTTTFSPNAACTRAQAMTFLWTAEGKPTTLNTIQFKDVGSGSYYYQAVRWAAKNKITSGTTAATFSPNAKCTRAQIVAFLYQTMA